MNLTKLLTLLIVSCFTAAVSAQIVVEDTTSVSNQEIQVGGDVTINYQSPKEYTIGPVRVEGAENYDPNAIRLISGLRQGQKITIPGQQVADAISNLWKEGLFSDVQIIAERELAGVIYLVIKVAPRPKLAKYRFVGVNKREADKIREEIDLYTGKTISENLLYQTESKIVGFFREKGNYAVKVNIQRTPDNLMNNSEVFIINIDKGKRVGIKKIEIEGVESMKVWKLKRAMKDTKQKAFWRIFKRSKFTESAYSRDKKAVIAKLNSIGLRDAHVTFDTVYMRDEKNLMIKMKIEEGNKYYFGDITWIGNTKFRTSFLDTVLGIKNGDVYDKPLLEQRLFMSQDGRDISSLYMDRGYLFFQVIPVETNVVDNHINYQMRIIEGKEARIRNIIIRGNTKTNEHVIRREIRTRPGDLFNRNDIIRTQRDLAQLGYFNEQAFQVNPIPNPQDGTVDIEYVVEEKSSDQIELSGGYGGVNQLTGKASIIGTLGLTFNNFSMRNIFKEGAWSPLPSGDGQRLSLRGQTNGKYYQGYTISFTEPWLGGKKPNSLSVWANHTAIGNGYLRKNENFTGIGITGVGVSFGRRRKYPDDYFTEAYELSYQYYDTKKYAIFSDLQTGFANDIALKYTIQRNSISAPIYPQYGSTITFSAKSTVPYSYFDGVSDYSTRTAQERYKYLEYYKLKLSGEWFFPLTTDKKLVLRTRVGFGLMGAYNNSKGLSPFDRFYLGGSGLTGVNQIGGREVIALRGYEDGSISAGAGDPLAAKYTMELRYPISLNPSATFFVLAFAEGGNSYPNFRYFNPINIKRSVGAGIRVFLPMFGMLGIDYGFGFDKLDPWAQGRGGTSDISIDQKGYYGKLTFTIGMNLGDL